MFDNWNAWTWVAVAWLQLLVAYGGYLAYLDWRHRRLLAGVAERPTLDARTQRGSS